MINPTVRAYWINTFSNIWQILNRLASESGSNEVDSVKLVTVKLPERLIDDMDQLVKAGVYHNRSDAIRSAVRELLRRELWQPNQG